MTPDTDALIIGSGIGGLTCGAFLAKAGLRVTVLEQHTKIGGYAHSFSRGGYNFDIGIHSVPMAADGMIFHLLKLLDCDKYVKSVEQEEMFRFISPQGAFAMPARRQEAMQMLMERYPAEKKKLGAFSGK